MPLALEPNQTFRVVLASDSRKPTDEQPFFKCSFLSERKWREFAATIDKIADAKNDDEASAKLLEVLATCVVGWGRMTDPATGKDIPYNVADFDRLLTLLEMWELIYKCRRQAFTGDDVKNLLSPSGSGSAASARSAPGRRSAKTRRRKRSPRR